MPKLKNNLLKSLGPGFVTGAADDDPAGIATYSQTGARFGLSFLFLAPLSFPMMATVQEMCARIGIVTGRGLSANIRRVFPLPVVIFLSVLLLIANTVNIGANLGAMVAVIQLLFPVLPHLLLIVVITLLSLCLQIFLPYHTYAKYLKWLAFVLVFYIFSALSVPNINWNEVLSHTIIPSFTLNKESIIMISAIFGTTISPYLFFWQTSQEVEEEIDNGKSTVKERMLAISAPKLTAMRWDVWGGMLFSNLIMFFIILATAVTLFNSDTPNIQSASDAALALKPFVGDLAYLVFSIGVLGTGLLAVPVLAGSSAYAVSEGLKKKEGLSKRWDQALVFYGVIVISMIGGLAINFVGIDPFQLLIISAVVNALVAPFILVAILLLSGNKKIMGKYRNNPISSIVGWGVVILMSLVAIATLFSLA